MQAPHYRSIVALLTSRESGYVQRDDRHHLLSTATMVADRELVRRHQITKIKNISPNKRSSYVIESSVDGYAVASHSNRCLSIIKTGKMEKTADIDYNQRTVWTLAVHPFDSRFIATGNMGGQVAIFKHFDVYRSVNTIRSSRVASITFHPSRRIVCFAILHLIYVWNWQDNVNLHVMCNDENTRFKLVKFNPGNEMLITGTTYDSERLHNVYDNVIRVIVCSASEMLHRLLDIVSMILHNIEINESYCDVDKPWRAALGMVEHWSPPPGSKCAAEWTGDAETVNNDLTLTVKVFADKIREWQDTIPDYQDHLKLMAPAELDIRPVVRKLRLILALYHREKRALCGNNECNAMSSADEALLMMVEQMTGLMCVRFAHPLLIVKGRFCIDRHTHLRIQAWEFAEGNYPDMAQEWRNIITHAYIHNDSTVEVTRCGKLIASFRELDWGRFEIHVQSLEPHTFADKLFVFENFQDAHIMSLSISPSREYLLVGMRSWHMFGYFLHITGSTRAQKSSMGRDLLADSQRSNSAFSPIDYYELDTGVVSCLRWMARPGDGVIIGYRSHHLRYIGYSATQ